MDKDRLLLFWMEKQRQSALTDKEVALELNIDTFKITEVYKTLKPEKLRKLCDLFGVQLFELQPLHQKMIQTVPRTINELFSKIAFDNNITKSMVSNIAGGSYQKLSVAVAKKLYDELAHINPAEMIPFIDIPIAPEPHTNAEALANYLFNEGLTFKKYCNMYNIKFNQIKDCDNNQRLNKLETYKLDVLKTHIQYGIAHPITTKGNPSKPA